MHETPLHPTSSVGQAAAVVQVADNGLGLRVSETAANCTLTLTRPSPTKSNSKPKLEKISR